MRQYRITMSRIMKMREMHRNAFRKQAELSLVHLDKIERHILTEVLQWPDFKDAYDYVDKLFPEANVKSIKIYKCDPDLLGKLGYKGVGGFFNRIFQVVVIPSSVVKQTQKTMWDSIQAKLTFDEVMVHELLHYSSSNQKKGVYSIDLEEEFAYGHSVAYLRQKGYSDKDIINNNFMPYLIGTINSSKIARQIIIDAGYDVKELVLASEEKQKRIFKKYEKQIFELVKQKAFEKGLEIINMYSTNNIDTISEVKINDGSSRFNMMDL